MKYRCECIDCGHTMDSDQHCSSLSCPECGGQMRRKERPGPGRTFDHNSDLAIPEAQWNSIVVDRLPEEAFAADRGYAHHYIVNGKRGEDGKYSGGKMLLHKGGLIEAYREAKKDGAGPEIIGHLENHLAEAAITIRQPERKNIYLGITGEMKMNGLLPRIDEIDLNRVVAKIDRARARSGDDVEGRELELINNIARADIKKSDLYLFPVWASNDLPDSYFTRMDPATTLPNYVTDFKDGRGLMLSHAESMLGGSPAEKMPLGSSFNASLTTRPDKAGRWVEAWLYILRDITVGDLNTNDAIRMIEAGIWKRVSIGFSIQPMDGRPQGRYICEVCNNNLLSGDCEHLPGFEYDGQVCVARVEGGGLREVSLVYMNAAQGTVVQKARMLADAGRLKEKDILALEMSYGVRFFDKPKTSIVAPKADEAKERNRKKQERTMEEMRAILLGLVDMFSKVGQSRELEALSGRATKAKDEESLAIIGTDLAEQARTILNDSQAHRELVEALPEESRTLEGIQALIANAADGEAHRSSVLEEALSEGVRFEGEEFDSEHWKSTLARMPLVAITKQRDIWKKQADSRLKPGRQSADTPGDGVVAPTPKVEERKSESNGIPEDAFRHGKAFV